MIHLQYKVEETLGALLPALLAVTGTPTLPKYPAAVFTPHLFIMEPTNIRNIDGCHVQ